MDRAGRDNVALTGDRRYIGLSTKPAPSAEAKCDCLDMSPRWWCCGPRLCAICVPIGLVRIFFVAMTHVNHSGFGDARDSELQSLTPALAWNRPRALPWFDGRRLFDVAISLVFLFFLSPVLLFAAALVRLTSAGPVIYRQERVGLHGRTFTLFKFRSMVAHAEADGRPRWASRRDPRITRVGALMRATRMDELPQLFNVLSGQMSFIGPRPERPHFVQHLAQVIPNYEERARVKPGITGWAQVNHPYGASVEDASRKLFYDLEYIRDRSARLDLKILLSTIRVVVTRDGAR